MIPDHKQFLEAINERMKVRVRFYSIADSGVIDSVCAPMDYGSGDAPQGGLNRYEVCACHGSFTVALRMPLAMQEMIQSPGEPICNRPTIHFTVTAVSARSRAHRPFLRVTLSSLAPFRFPPPPPLKCFRHDPFGVGSTVAARSAPSCSAPRRSVLCAT